MVNFTRPAAPTSLEIAIWFLDRARVEDKQKHVGSPNILQDKSLFPGMTVEKFLSMDGCLMEKPSLAKEAAENVFQKHPRLAELRASFAGNQPLTGDGA